MDIIYIDSLFFINLIIDYFILLATAKLCGLVLRRLRFGLAAALGGLWSVLTVVPGFGFFGDALMKLALSVAMVLVAFGGERRFLRNWAAFLLLSAAFGGAVWAASMLGGVPRGTGRTVPVSLRVLIFSFGACYAAVCLLFRRAAKKREREVHMIFISLGDRFAHFPALRDTGNELYDPMSGMHVCVAEKKALASLFPGEGAAALDEEDPAEMLRKLSAVPGFTGRFRLVPYVAVGVQGGLMVAFHPDTFTVNGVEDPDVLVALSPTPLGANGEYAAVL
jgi:stage II sporulation protein GA (sporulation sigma-E factor processing peptidase)